MADCPRQVSQVSREMSARMAGNFQNSGVTWSLINPSFSTYTPNRLVEPKVDFPIAPVLSILPSKSCPPTLFQMT